MVLGIWEPIIPLGPHSGRIRNEGSLIAAAYAWSMPLEAKFMQTWSAGSCINS